MLFYSKLKFQALIIAKKKNLTENEFLLELLDQIKSMDSTTYRKVKEQINKSIKEINPNILSKKPFLKKDNINQIRELKRLVNKTNFDVYDIEFLNQINDSFFAFNNILKTTIRVTNDFYELLDRINDNSIKRVILNNYFTLIIVKSAI